MTDEPDRYEAVVFTYDHWWYDEDGWHHEDLMESDD